jgi:NAD(P)H-dependent FMN reductase
LPAVVSAVQGSEGARREPVRILGLGGSLRARSTSAALLRVASRLAPPAAVLHVTEQVGRVPLFDIDVEMAGVPPEVAVLRDELERAEAVLVCSPEYAHGVPGAFKNALDWLVGVGLGRRPVGIVNPSASSVHAFASLQEILATMDGELVPDAVVAIPPGLRAKDDEGLLADDVVTGILRGCLAALAGAVSAGREPPAGG